MMWLSSSEAYFIFLLFSFLSLHEFFKWFFKTVSITFKRFQSNLIQKCPWSLLFTHNFLTHKIAGWHSLDALFASIAHFRFTFIFHSNYYNRLNEYVCDNIWALEAERDPIPLNMIILLVGIFLLSNTLIDIEVISSRSLKKGSRKFNEYFA